MVQQRRSNGVAWSTLDLASCVGVTPNTIRKWIGGTIPRDAGNLLRLAHCLGATVQELLDPEDQKLLTRPEEGLQVMTAGERALIYSEYLNWIQPHLIARTNSGEPDEEVREFAKQNLAFVNRIYRATT
jgi:transcriptional regulator with XRE-family HTH domain